jgi:hypothetical protein
MKIRTKILLIASTPFLCFFVFGVTQFGQRYLEGDISAETDHWKADDIVMGAGLAPWVYGLAPFILLFACWLISWVLDLRKKSK